MYSPIITSLRQNQRDAYVQAPGESSVARCRGGLRRCLAFAPRSAWAGIRGHLATRRNCSSTLQIGMFGSECGSRGIPLLLWMAIAQSEDGQHFWLWVGENVGRCVDSLR